ncbi:uncharacterized protein PITG_12112 [Phytophthora infestans T30-4]|uniref:Uncharacterized protein n=1 Tax=Phytophthora infestans (strain T30-4) TaxID=403677 RepID=D0NJ25_PHYIT|nr:uncharacterized protein PITG_12112 [Phytophthora infestans T30-4]EEY59543.1 conserved hypothetical protein [Phytophthora infestans T30-4]|eukprot:XP_002900736.1 conserved hypothetical protein [Phytophthora infestans T30-4]
MTSAEVHRDLVVDGDVAQALDMCRRLLRTESSLQRVETAHLVLERLRSGADDSSDDVNALLHLLGNYVAPTRELTEEILSLLLFCDHHVLLIHHLPKLTYQSKECVQLVVQAYLELLATDRSLLVPVLGSLAEMPLDNSEKNTVVEATQSLLDAAVEEDIPAVVQSLLSMVTKLSAPKALARLRTECNRIQSGTLSLTMEVIERFTTAGSVALTALLRLIRHAEPLTTFDIVLLTFVMGKSAENELAVRTTTSVAQSGRLHGRMMREAAAMLVRPEWAYLLPSFVRFCSCLLAVCFRASTQPALALNLIASSVDSLVVLIETKSTAQEEALILLLTIASHPKKLLLLGNSDSVQRTRSALCWKVAEVIALRFSELARRNADALASSSHLFLDHLHGVASATTESEVDGKYPSHILDLLCSTMALLTKKERGIYSLLMITIQKQLVSRAGSTGLAHSQQSIRLQSGRSGAAEVKQLMAVFLTGHLLKNQVVVESRDRKSLANWMLRLLTSANRDETLLHVMCFVRDEMNRTREVSALEQERALLTTAMSQVFRKKGLTWTPREQVLQQTQDGNDFVLAFDDDKEELAAPLAVDATEFVVKMRFGTPSPAFFAMDTHERETTRRLTEQDYLMKICLLRELFNCYLEFAPPAEQTEVADAAFVLPSAYTLGLDAETWGSVEPAALNNVIWNLVCALDIAVASTNFVAEQYTLMIASSKTKHECITQYSRMATRLRICLKLRDQLEQILADQKCNIQDRLGRSDDTSSSRTELRKHELEWLLLECLIVEQLLNGQLRRVQGELPRASLFGLDLRVVCLAFEGQWKQRIDTPLSLPSELLVSRSEGRRTVKWLCRRAAELSRAISNEEYDQPESVMEGDFEADSTDAAAANTATRNLMAHCLACIYDSFIVVLEECRIATAAGDSSWTDQMMKLLAVGASPDDDASRCVNLLGCNEIFFRFLARQCLELTDPTLACLVTDVLISLVLNTRKSPLVSQLCLALLHQTFPSLPTPHQFESDTTKFFNGLPLRSLPNTVVSPSNGRVCSLANYRCNALKWRHIAYLVVGSWAYSASASAGSFLLAQYLEEMRVLIDAAVPHQDKRSSKKRAARIKESDDDSDDDDLEEKRRQDELAVVVGGEHIVLKSLTHESLSYFIEAVLLCAIASLYRATPRKASSQGLSDFNPFLEYCRAMHVFESALRVFARAEMCGFNLPVKTNLLVLRGGTFATRTAKSIIMKCIAWRVEQSVTDNTGALRHLSVLFGAADAMATTMETVTTAFQERVMLKMQHNGNVRRKGGWTNELLAKAYGKKYNTRRWISKSEAKLLPFFSHGIQELQDFLQDQSAVNNIALDAARTTWGAAESVWSDHEHQDVMLSDDKLVSACRTLHGEELTAALLRDWRPALSMDNDDDETDLQEDKEIAELDEESLLVSTRTGRKKPTVELQDNEDLGFPTIVVNFKKQKKTHRG